MAVFLPWYRMFKVEAQGDDVPAQSTRPWPVGYTCSFLNDPPVASPWAWWMGFLHGNPLKLYTVSSVCVSVYSGGVEEGNRALTFLILQSVLWPQKGQEPPQKLWNCSILAFLGQSVISAVSFLNIGVATGCSDDVIRIHNQCRPSLLRNSYAESLNYCP